MKYIYAIKGSAIAFVVFVVAAIVMPIGEPASEAELILTVSTFLFAILAGFFISRSNGRYNQMRELIAAEDAMWLSVYEYSRFFGNKFSEKITDIIERYYITVLSTELGEYYKQSAKYLHELYDEFIVVKIKPGSNAEQIFDEMVGTVSSIEDVRNKSSVLTLERLTKGQWGVLILLAAIIIFSVFVLKGGIIYSNVTTVLLSTILVLILLTIRDLENFKLSGQTLVIESAQENLEAMGKLRYYHYRDIQEGTVSIPSYVKEYRVGMQSPGDPFDLKVIKVGEEKNL